KEYFSYLRDRIFHRFNLPNQHEHTKNIYISRSKAHKRRLINEDQVVKFLSAYDFRAYVLEQMSFEEQVRLFHQARMVVAPHGAGLTNMIFAGQIPVLEILGLQPIPVFCFLTHSLGQPYSYIM